MTMYRGLIQVAREEAQAFIGACDEALAKLDVEKDRRNRARAYRDEPPVSGGIADYSHGSKETGALRRKSMDLTRTLAELRK